MGAKLDIYNLIEKENYPVLAIKGGMPQFTEAQFDHLIREDHSNYSVKKHDPAEI